MGGAARSAAMVPTWNAVDRSAKKRIRIRRAGVGVGIISICTFVLAIVPTWNAVDRSARNVYA